MEVVPHLVDNSVPVVGRTSTSSSGVVSWSGAANVWSGAVALGQSGLHGAQRVGGGVAWLDTSLVQPTIGRQTAVVHDGGLEELDDLLVLNVFRSVARNVKGRVAGCVLGEFVAPEVVVWTALVDPKSVHVGEQVKFAEWGQKGSDVWSGVWWNDGAWLLSACFPINRFLSIIPFGRPLVVFGDGDGSYCLLRSQYWV